MHVYKYVYMSVRGRMGAICGYSHGKGIKFQLANSVGLAARLGIACDVLER
jgi:hypothetical protein